jgi:hypothetical protein
MKGMGNLSLMMSFFKARKLGNMCQEPYFLRTMTTRIRIGACTRMDNAYGEQFLNNFLNFIFMGKGMMIGMNIGRNVVMGQGEWNDHEHHEKDASPWGEEKTT